MFSERGITLSGPFGVESSSDHAVAIAAVYSVEKLSKPSYLITVMQASTCNCNVVLDESCCR